MPAAAVAEAERTLKAAPPHDGHVLYAAACVWSLASRAAADPGEARRHAEVVVEFGVARPVFDGPADQLDGIAVAAGLVGQHAQQVQGGRVVRLALDELPAQGLRLPEAARLEVLEGLCKCRHK